MFIADLYIPGLQVIVLTVTSVPCMALVEDESDLP